MRQNDCLAQNRYQLLNQLGIECWLSQGSQVEGPEAASCAVLLPQLPLSCAEFVLLDAILLALNLSRSEILLCAPELPSRQKYSRVKTVFVFGLEAVAELTSYVLPSLSELLTEPQAKARAWQKLISYCEEPL